MKKQIKRITAFAAAVAMAAAFTFPAEIGDSFFGFGNVIVASAESSGEWVYTVNADQTVTITGYQGWGGAVEIPADIDGKSVTSIGNGAFRNCPRLKRITIPDGVTSIGNGAFENCFELTSINIPDGVTSIGTNAFNGCSGLTDITVDNRNSSYCSESGVLFNKNKTKFICYPAGKTDSSYKIPDEVTSIGYAAFEECTGLTSIYIPDGVTSIGDYAFERCTGLESITIPDSVNSIGYEAFDRCTKLTSIYIPDGEISIGFGAIPSKTTRITYIVNSDGSVTITKIELTNGQNTIDIPAAINGKTVIAVEEGYRSCVGNHTCASSTPATCINEAACGICGQDYYGDHNISHHDAAAHTCTADGTIEYWECSVCGKKFSDADRTIEITNIVDPNDPARHSLVKTDAKAPTCTDDGNRAYWTCTECGNIFSDDAGLNPTTLAEVTVSATGHNWSNDWSSDETEHWHTCSGCDEKVDFEAHTEDSGTVTVQPTETSTGVMTYYCSVCGYEMRTEEIPATGSNYYPTYPTYPTNPAVSSPSVFTESLAVKSESDGSTAALSWDKAENADKYCVYQYKDGKYVKIKTTTDTSVTLEDLKNGETYKYLIRYMIDGKLSPLAYSDKITVKVYYKPIVSASAEKDSVTLRWNAVPNAEKYAIYKYADGKAVKLAETEKRAAKIIGLTPDTEYQYIVSAYVDGKWTTMLKSDIVTVRTKAE